MKLSCLNLGNSLFFGPFFWVICSLLLEKVLVLHNIDGGISFISIVELVGRFSEQLLLNVAFSSFIIFVRFLFVRSLLWIVSLSSFPFVFDFLFSDWVLLKWISFNSMSVFWLFWWFWTGQHGSGLIQVTGCSSLLHFLRFSFLRVCDSLVQDFSDLVFVFLRLSLENWKRSLCSSPDWAPTLCLLGVGDVPGLDKVKLWLSCNIESVS